MAVLSSVRGAAVDLRMFSSGNRLPNVLYLKRSVLDVAASVCISPSSIATSL